MAKRAFDLFFSALGLLALSPLLLLLAIGVKLTSRGPVFFRQQRVGEGGRLFYILKFRSMVMDSEKLGPSVTRDGDPRITPLGRLLRKTKVDELPQLWNVLAGDMSFVGPRPEVPGYVRLYTPEQRRVLELKPGITDLATIEFRNEEELLSAAGDTDKFYLEYCVPRKIELNLAYAATANVWEDAKIIVRTVLLLIPN
jgi:lipopolysaccharide/colanic/teichoic acid biosynthesis glycosyltransferase